MNVELTLNGEAVSWESEPHEFLTELLRRHGLIGTKRGCESGDCGACAVLLDGEEVPSCLVLAAQAHGHEVTTIEGLGSWERPHPIQEAFVDGTAVQCGYCTPGMVIAAKAYLDRKGGGPLSEREARELLAGHVCRCTGYVKPIAAVLRAAEALGDPRSAGEEERA
ncbi:MAG: (2Fe-2S)-binding protein [Planctomycetota bacterium]|nr:MAG: (2Fe-2S)-binding protein [Planctomycetota bacterium]